VQRRDRQEEELARQKAAEYAADQPQVPYAHTGFTGMNPPVTQMAPAAGQQTLQADPYGYGAAQAAQQEYRAAWAARQENTAPANNISYMPGLSPDAGSTFTHVEHIMAVTSLKSCYEAIECMKNGETLILTLDVLGSEGESIRCQDMLAGAAFTLGCSVRTLQSVGVIVIAPAGVKMLPEQERRSYTERVQPVQMNAPAHEEYVGRRERRVSQNPVGWGNTEATGYNPYTGTAPAAAGTYGAYGGY